MKSRKTVVAIFLMVAILTLGIGYAALSDELSVTATANTPAFDPLVYIGTDYDITSATRNGASIADPTSNDDYTITVSGTGTDAVSVTVDRFLATSGDSIVFEFTVVNESAFEVTLGTPTVTYTTNDGTFTATAVLGSSTLAAATTANPEVSTTLTVTINLANDVTNDSGASETITITMNANA